MSLLAVLATTTFWFWVAACGVGLLAGPNQSASRSLMGRFVPRAKENQFFGFFAFSGKATAFLGPLLLGQLTYLFDSQRVGVSTVLFLFAMGAAVMLTVNESEGMKLASNAEFLRHSEET